MWKYSHSLSSCNLIEVTLLYCEHIAQPNLNQDKTKPRQFSVLILFPLMILILKSQLFPLSLVLQTRILCKRNSCNTE